MRSTDEGRAMDSGPVKISSLELENVKRIRAIQLVPTPDGLTVIGGNNAQGKTSVLDAIAWALGGNKMKPEAPNRDGAANPARLHVELSNGIVVERAGKNGALKVTDSRGLKGGQALLDEFVGQLALDLPRFMGGTDKQRADYLLGILGVDAELARIDRDIKSTYEERRYVGREADQKQKVAESSPYYEDAPAEPVSIDELTRRLNEAMTINASNLRKRDILASKEAERDKRLRSVEELEARLAQEREAYGACVADCADAKTVVDSLHEVDTAPIEDAIRSAEGVNAKVRANRAKADAQAEADGLRGDYEALTGKLDGLRAERVALLDGAGMPLSGLSVEDGVLTYNGHVWSDMSGAEQLRVATAITRATKPECGFVLVDKLEQFDTAQLAQFAAWAEGEGLQVIGTRVATDGSCTVVIEDGRIVGQEVAETPPADPRGTSLAWDGRPWGDGGGQNKEESNG